MKVTTGKPHSSATAALVGASILTSKAFNQSPRQQNPDSDLVRPPRRRTRSLTRLKRVAPSVGRRSRPETPLLKWKVEESGERKNGGRAKGVGEDIAVAADEGEEKQGNGKEEGRRRRSKRSSGSSVSARKLATGLWRLQTPETAVGGGGVGERRRRDGLGFQPRAAHAGVSLAPHGTEKVYGSELKDPLHSATAVSAMKNRFLCKLEPSFQFSNSAMEGKTKWDPVCFETPDEVRQIYSHMNRLDQQVSAVSVVSALESELEQARVRIHELETERRSSKKKLEHFLKKVSEERATWRSREHEKIRAFIDDIKSDLSRERKNRQRLEILNSKLVNELADVKVSGKRLMQDYEKERKGRELIEEVCDELAKEIGDDKAEIEAIKRESMKLREEVDDERKMLQIAEVWREERVQMKLVDAKVALEEKYSQMNKLVSDLESFLRSRGAAISEVRQVESLMQAAAATNIEEVKEFTYMPSNPDDIFDVLEEYNSGEPNDERDIEQCTTAFSPGSHCNGYVINQNEEIEEDESGWETVSHLDDQGSSFSPDGSVPSVNKIHRDSNVSESGTEWEEENICKDTHMAEEISELCSLPNNRQVKKASAIARLWKSGSNGENYKIISVDGMNGRFSNGRKPSAGIVVSPDRGSGKDRGGSFSPSDFVGQWSSSPESGNPHITRGMKGCIEWPRGSVQKHSLKSQLLEARMQSQKLQLRHVLKQNI
ncbi:unnamed protein product [Linum trigynum]|uniref:Uncharacterized protein n=1 Tax=Linum trigynum TaxID=586398 RepID=A0AAV2CCT9_9ROSI